MFTTLEALDFAGTGNVICSICDTIIPAEPPHRIFTLDSYQVEKWHVQWIQETFQCDDALADFWICEECAYGLDVENRLFIPALGGMEIWHLVLRSVQPQLDRRNPQQN